MAFVYLYHPTTAGGTLVPDDESVIAHYLARGWVEGIAPSTPASGVEVVTWSVAIRNMGGVGRIWGRSAAEGLPSAAEGAQDGDWCMMDAS